MRNSNTLTAAVVMMFLAFGVFNTAEAGPSAKQSRIKQIRNQRNELYQKVGELNKKADVLDDEIARVDGRISSKQNEIRTAEKQLKQKTAELKTAQNRKSEIEADMARYKDTLGNRLRAVYMQGDLSYIDLLFHSADFSELVDRVFFVQTICERDEDLIGDAQKQQIELEQQVALIDTQMAEIQRIKEQLRTQYGSLAAMRREKNQNLAAIESDKELYLRQIKEMEAESRRIQESIRAKQRSASGYAGKPWTSSFKKPCAGSITSGFGYRKHPIFGVRKMHTGVDIAAASGTKIIAAGNGKVIETGWMGGYGNAVVIDHGKGRATLYGHCSRITCSAGQEVKAGDKIAEVGSTGNSTGPHCHFEVRINGTPVDPMGSL